MMISGRFALPEEPGILPRGLCAPTDLQVTFPNGMAFSFGSLEPPTSEQYLRPVVDREIFRPIQVAPERSG